MNTGIEIKGRRGRVTALNGGVALGRTSAPSTGGFFH